MCEFSPHQPAWTLESGLCLPDRDYDDPRYPAWNIMNASELTDGDKCLYLFRCILSENLERNCPCHYRNCTEMMMNVCPDDRYVIYPGYFVHTRVTLNVEAESEFVRFPFMLQFLCTIDIHQYIYRDILSSHQYDKFCWNNSLTFNGRTYAVKPDICNYVTCISQYRIHDVLSDCFLAGDDQMTLGSYCTGNVGRHRFQCFDDQNQCLPLWTMGSGMTHCSNNYDEMWFDTDVSLRDYMPCTKTNFLYCSRLKEYITQSSATNSSNHNSFSNVRQQILSNRIRFRQYCDSFWDLNKHLDELKSSCQYWICPDDQYQCLTGQ